MVKFLRRWTQVPYWDGNSMRSSWSMAKVLCRGNQVDQAQRIRSSLSSSTGTRAVDLLVGTSSAVFRRKWAWLMSALSLSKLFKPYCLRRGGATFEWTTNNNAGRLCLRGRWSHLSTARLYAVEGQELLSRHQLTPEARENIIWWTCRLPALLQRLRYWMTAWQKDWNSTPLCFCWTFRLGDRCEVAKLRRSSLSHVHLADVCPGSSCSPVSGGWQPPPGMDE